MSEAATARQAQALLDLVEADRAAKCADLASAAEARVAQLCADAHAGARSRMRGAFEDERRLRAERLGAATAELETRRRAVAQARDAALLAAGWAALPEALAARWRDPTGRRAWIADAVAAARSTLPRAKWRIVHAPGMTDAERETLAAEVRAAAGCEPQIAEDTANPAGLAIAVEGTAIDATARGLLAARADSGARLLDLLHRETR